MEVVRIAFGGRIAAALHRADMNQYGGVQFFRPLQRCAKPLNVVTVHGAQIGESHIFKESASQENGLFEQRFPAVDEAVQRIARRMFPEQAAVVFFEMVIGGLAPQMVQVRGQSADIRINGHAVIVEDNDKRLAGSPGVIHALIGQSARHGAVADEG